MMTWLHEIGHQVHIKAGGVNLNPPAGTKHATKYSKSVPAFEWFSEHFVAWLINYEEYATFDKVDAEFFDEFMEKVLKN